LKSAVKREVDRRILENWELSLDDKREISFEFQNAVNEVLAYKLVSWAKEKNVKTILLAGWVSANDDLKNKIKNLASKNNLEFIYPTKNLYCMDNAAMIWILAYYKIKYFKF
jgi:N6-L-threonylcarbamoyladenine synthase